MRVDVRLPSAKRVMWVLSVAVIVLISLSVLGQISKYSFDHPKLKGFVPAFYVDYESNVPTWYSSFALGMAGGLLALVALVKHHRRDAFRLHWAILAVVFFGLSLDEVAMFHEYPIEPLREAFDAGGLFYYTWVVPGALFVALMGFSFQRFLRHLPKRTGMLFMLSAMVFVGGAIGVEMLSGMHADLFGEENFTYAMIITCEEFMEMLGVVIFIYALADYINTALGGIRLQFGSEPDHETRPTPAAGKRDQRRSLPASC